MCHVRSASALARLQTRKATPWSQLATESALRTERALRNNTRNVAWKASSTSCAAAQELTANTEHHGPMTLHQDGEGGLISPGVGTQAMLQKLPVREIADYSELERMFS